jgi:hypothetical protein
MASYNKKTVKAITDLIKKDSYTIAEICASVGISESCFYKWQAERVEFTEAIVQAKLDANMRFLKMARNSLVKKLEGYTVQENHITYIDSKDKDEHGKIVSKPRIKEKKVVEKHFQPDTQAIMFALTNLEGETWKNRQSTELTGKDGKDLINTKSDEELDARIAELEKKLKG